VTVRYLTRDAEDTHTELFGVLQGVAIEDGAQVLKVMDKRGRTHVVVAADIVAGRAL
jgi:hypothetical protein